MSEFLPDHLAAETNSTDVRSSAGREDDAIEFARSAARIIHDHRTEDVAILDLRGMGAFADFFVIGSGTSDRQMHAAIEQLRMHAKSVGRTPYRVADSSASAWILADYVDVVVHLFDPVHREYYDLEGLWGDAPRLDWGSSETAE